MKYSILRRLSCALLSIFVYGKAQFLNAVEPEDILAPAIGPVVILPKATLSIGYDDNVFLSGNNTNNAEDVITTFSPGVALQYGQNILDSNYIGIDYSPSFLWYADNNELNTDNHSLTFGINYQKEGKFTFSGTDNIDLSNTLLRGRERALVSALEDGSDASGGLLIKRFSSVDRYQFEYVISPKTSVYISTSADIVDYEEGAHYYYKTVFGDLIPYSLFDVANWNNTIGFGWQAFSKIKLYGSFFYGTTSVETNLGSMGLRPDSDISGGHISAKAEFSDRLNGRLQFGYQKRDFDLSDNGIGGNNHGLPIFEAELEYQYTDKGEISFAYTRKGNVSVESPNTAVNSDFATISIDQKIGTTGKFITKIDSSYRLDSYETVSGLEYKYLRLGLGLTYRFNDWMRSSLMYNIDVFDSNKGNIDYKSNRVMLGLSVGY
jgi:hypothetical protein